MTEKKEDLSKVALYSLEDERVFLAALLQDPKFIVELDSFEVKPDVFFFLPHKTLYSAILATFGESGAVDAYILTNRLKTLGITTVNDISIFDYITEYLAPISVNRDFYPQYTQNLLRWYFLREADKRHSKARNDLRRNRDKSLPEIMEMIEKTSEDISTIRVSNLDEEFVDLFGQGESVLKGIAESETPMGLYTPWKSYNDKYGPLTYGDAYIFAAQKKTGKSTFLMALSSHLAKQGNGNVLVLFCDTEMESWRQMTRNAAAETGIKEFYFRNGGFKDDKNMISKAERVFEQWKDLKGRVFHLYAADKTIDDIEILVKRFHSRYIKEGYSLCLTYDYLKTTGESTENQKEWEVLGNKMNVLKKLASSLKNTIVISAIQLNEENNIAMSSRISWFSSQTMFLKRKTPQQLENHGLQYGNVILEEYVTRSQGEFYEQYVPVAQGGETRYIKNSINLDFNNFNIVDKGDYKKMIAEIEARNGQLQLAEPKENKYRKALKDNDSMF